MLNHGVFRKVYKFRIFESRVLKTKLGITRMMQHETRENCAIRVSRFVLNTEYFSCRQIKGNEVGKACGMYKGG